MSLIIKFDEKDKQSYEKDKFFLSVKKVKSTVVDGNYYEVDNSRTGKTYKVRKFYQGRYGEDPVLDCTCEHFQRRLKGTGKGCKHLATVYLRWRESLREKENK